MEQQALLAAAAAASSSSMNVDSLIQSALAAGIPPLQVVQVSSSVLLTIKAHNNFSLSNNGKLSSNKMPYPQRPVLFNINNYPQYKHQLGQLHQQLEQLVGF